MVVRSSLTKSDIAKSEAVIKEYKPATQSKQKLIEKQEKMFYALSKDDEFQKSIIGLETKDRTTTIQKKYSGNGVKITRRKVRQMMEGGVTIAKLLPIVMPKPLIVAPGVPKPQPIIPKSKPKIVSTSKEPVSKVAQTLDKAHYQVYDVNGLVGVFTTTLGLEQFRKYLFNLGEFAALKEFVKRGASVITQELTDDIFTIKSNDKNINKTIITLQKLIEKADTMVIINTGD